MSKFARKVDTNQPEIKQKLTAAGYAVMDMSFCGRGVPDLLVMSKSYRFVFLEVKQPKGKLTDDEAYFFNIFGIAPCYVVRSVEDALETMRIEDFVK